MKNSQSLSEAVRDHYDRHPYPDYPFWLLGSWRNSESVDLATWGISGAVRSCWIVGSGAVAPLFFARRNPHVQFLAQDLSRKSCQIAKWRCFLNGFHNIQFKVGDFLEENFEENFDAIDAYGVLHHLENPRRGLQKLWSLLRVGGVLRIMVYSIEARSRIEVLRRQISELGLRGVPEVKTWLKNQGVEMTGDLSNDSGIADALLHPLAHTFAEEDLKQLLAGIEGFELSRSGLKSNFVMWIKRVK